MLEQNFIIVSFLEYNWIKSLRNVYDAKAYLPLIAIHPSYWDFNPGVSLVLFEASRLTLAPGFPFTLPHLIFITHNLYEYLHRNIHPRLLKFTSTWCRIENWS